MKRGGGGEGRGGGRGSFASKGKEGGLEFKATLTDQELRGQRREGDWRRAGRGGGEGLWGEGRGGGRGGEMYDGEEIEMFILKQLWW